MTQALSIIRDALEEVRVADASAVPAAVDVASALSRLNRMMRTLEVDGISLGWQDVAAATDELPTPPEADEAIMYGLAVRLAASYGVSLAPATVELAASSLGVLRALVASNQYLRVRYDDLPTGTGQRCGNPSEFFTR